MSTGLRPEAAEAIALVRAAGVDDIDCASGAEQGPLRAELKHLATLGLDAVEADHPDHPPSQAGDLARQAKDCGLLVTGGSDFHGPRTGQVELGAPA